VEPEFLTMADVLHIHRNQVETFGGRHGLRDMGLLQSALAQPHASYGGRLLPPDFFAMAAAYLYHIAQNHPFLDGNKRTGAMAAMVFLDWNGITLQTDNDGLASIAFSVAEGKATKRDAADFFRALAHD
jgi:death-on-curing protein